MSEQKKVYLITSGEYSDFSIEIVFESKELAEQHIKTLQALNPMLSYDIQEYQLNKVLPVRIVGAEISLRTGDFVREYRAWDYEGMKNTIYGHTHNKKIAFFSKDLENALKGARDWRAQILAEREGVS